MMSYHTNPVKGVRGEIRVAPDKSISHRSLMFASLADGESNIENLLAGEDVLRTLAIVNALGVSSSIAAKDFKADDSLVIRGAGLTGLQQPDQVLYCGNSGTTMRLMLGLLSGQCFEAVLTGDGSLNKRPMDRVMNPLKQMGARFDVYHESGQRMIRTGGGGLKGIRYDSAVPSAQVKSAILLAGLYASGVTAVTEPGLSRNHTEIMLQSMGVPLQIQGLMVSLKKVGSLKPLQIKVPGDFSSAAFFIVAALITRDSDLMIRNVSLNPTRTGLLYVLLKMGADINISNEHVLEGEAVGDLRIRSSRLKNVSLGGDLIPRLIDELPILALAGSVAEGEMIVKDAAELRVKETDRIAAISTELRKLGVFVEDHVDGFVIRGKPGLAGPDADLHSYGDHRMAMMGVIAGLIYEGGICLDDVSCVQTSFPNFFDLLDTSRE